MLDSSGRLFGKVSILDILVAVAALAVALGFLLSHVTEQGALFVSPTEEFYVVFESNRMRPVVADALAVGDAVFRRHGGQPIGVVTHIGERRPAVELMLFGDGTAAYVEMEGRYRFEFTVRAYGSVTPMGYFVNGNDHIAPGSGVEVVSYRAFLPETTVVGIRGR